MLNCFFFLLVLDRPYVEYRALIEMLALMLTTFLTCLLHDTGPQISVLIRTRESAVLRMMNII